LTFEKPDRVPCDLWLSSGFKKIIQERLGLSFDELLDEQDVDLRYIQGPAYVGPTLRTYGVDSEEDVWGVRRRRVSVRAGEGSETYWEVETSPLAGVQSVEEVLSYPGWPNPDWFDYGDIERQCDEILEKDRVVVFMGDRMNRMSQLKPGMYLRGVEQILMDMALEPEIAQTIFARIREFYCAYAQRIFTSANGKIDLLLSGDDFGSQNGPLVSPEMWARFLGDGFEQYIKLAKSYGARVVHHTCGSVRPIITLMIERGLDVLQSLQPEARGMDAGELKREFGDRLAFHGGLSVQRTMPRGSPEEVRATVEKTIQTLSPGGGYIFGTAHNIQADTPVENFIAMLEAFEECSR